MASAIMRYSSKESLAIGSGAAERTAGWPVECVVGRTKVLTVSRLLAHGQSLEDFFDGIPVAGCDVFPEFFFEDAHGIDRSHRADIEHRDHFRGRSLEDAECLVGGKVGKVDRALRGVR